MPEQKYDKAYFIAKFSAIPEELWCVRDFFIENRCCAFGHCGAKVSFNDTAESAALSGLLGHVPHRDGAYRGSGAAIVNDGHALQYQQPTPKQRILAALRDLPDVA